MIIEFEDYDELQKYVIKAFDTGEFNNSTKFETVDRDSFIDLYVDEEPPKKFPVPDPEIPF